MNALTNRPVLRLASIPDKGSDDGRDVRRPDPRPPHPQASPDDAEEIEHIDELLAGGEVYPEEAAYLRERRAELEGFLTEPEVDPAGMADQIYGECTLSQHALNEGLRIGQVCDAPQRYATVGARAYARYAGHPRSPAPTEHHRTKTYRAALPSMPPGAKRSTPPIPTDEEIAWGHTARAAREETVDPTIPPARTREPAPAHWRPVVLPVPPRRTTDEALAEMAQARRDAGGLA